MLLVFGGWGGAHGHMLILNPQGLGWRVALMWLSWTRARHIASEGGAPGARAPEQSADLCVGLLGRPKGVRNTSLEDCWLCTAARSSLGPPIPLGRAPFGEPQQRRRSMARRARPTKLCQMRWHAFSSKIRHLHGSWQKWTGGCSTRRCWIRRSRCWLMGEEFFRYWPLLAGVYYLLPVAFASIQMHNGIMWCMYTAYTDT